MSDGFTSVECFFCLYFTVPLVLCCSVGLVVVLVMEGWQTAVGK